MIFEQITEHLNKKKIETVSGKKFSGAHVHSIVKKKDLKIRN